MYLVGLLNLLVPAQLDPHSEERTEACARWDGLPKGDHETPRCPFKATVPYLMSHTTVEGVVLFACEFGSSGLRL